MGLADCDKPIVSTIALEAGLAEENDDFADELAAVDFDALPDTVSFTGVADFLKAIVAWGLDVPVVVVDGTVGTAELREQGIIGDVVVAAFNRPATPGDLDFTFFRQGLHRYNACARQWPLTLDGFKAVYGDPTAGIDAVVIEDSQPKAPHARRLWTNPDVGLYLAETLDGGTVAETEVVMSGRRVDGALDFVVYDDVGNLSAVSRFATGGGTGTVQSAAPCTCLFCHANNDTLQFDVVHPR